MTEFGDEVSLPKTTSTAAGVVTAVGGVSGADRAIPDDEGGSQLLISAGLRTVSPNVEVVQVGDLGDAGDGAEPDDVCGVTVDCEVLTETVNGRSASMRNSHAGDDEVCAVVVSPSDGTNQRGSLLVPCTISVASTNGSGGGGLSSWLDGSDSCPSVSPSPGPDGGNTFVFDDVAALGGATEELSAALQAEKEFLDFMCSLPQVQESTGRLQQAEIVQPPAREEVSSLDHLGHLCRVVEQLAELKEQNVRLQRRVQYLEDLRLLHQMHRQMTETLKQERELEGSSSHHLQFGDERIVRAASEDSVRQPGGPESPHSRGGGAVGDNINNVNITTYNSSSSSRDPHFRPSLPARTTGPHQDLVHHGFAPLAEGGRGGRRRGTVGDASSGVMAAEASSSKEKKGHRSAWGKVKHIINTRKDNKKPPPSSLPHSKSELGTSAPTSYIPYSTSGEGGSADTTAGGDRIPRGIISEGSVASSDPEDYDIDYDPMYLLSEPLWDINDPEGDLAGIWMGPKESREPKEDFLSGLPSAGPYSSGPIGGLSASISTSTYSLANSSPTGLSPQSKVSPLLLSSTPPSATSSVSPTTPPSSSTNSQSGGPSVSPVPSPSSLSQEGMQGILECPPPAVSVCAPGYTEDTGLIPPPPSARDPAAPENLGVTARSGQHPKLGGITRNGRFKPHLTITVPSTEDLSSMKMDHQQHHDDLHHPHQAVELQQNQQQQQQYHQSHQQQSHHQNDHYQYQNQRAPQSAQQQYQQQKQHQQQYQQHQQHQQHKQQHQYQHQQYQQHQQHQHPQQQYQQQGYEQHRQQQHNSNWTKVKHAFLTPSSSNSTLRGGGGGTRRSGLTRATSMESTELGDQPTKKAKGNSHHPHPHHHQRHRRDGGMGDCSKDGLVPHGGVCDGGGSLPPSPHVKASFVFDEEGDQSHCLGASELGSLRLPSSGGHSRHTSGGSSGLAPSSPPAGSGGGESSLSTGGGSMLGMSQTGPAHGIIAAGGAVGRNLADLQRALTGEFNKKIHEWERLRGQQWLYGGQGAPAAPPQPAGRPVNSNVHSSAPVGAMAAAAGGPAPHLPHHFRKKLHEWEKMKEKERSHSGQSLTSPTNTSPTSLGGGPSAIYSEGGGRDPTKSTSIRDSTISTISTTSSTSTTTTTVSKDSSRDANSDMSRNGNKSVGNDTYRDECEETGGEDSCMGDSNDANKEPVTNTGQNMTTSNESRINANKDLGTNKDPCIGTNKDSGISNDKDPYTSTSRDPVINTYKDSSTSGSKEPSITSSKDDTKTRRHEEDSLPPEFRKKMTEWDLRMALQGKSKVPVEELQRQLGEEFMRKLEEWERIKPAAPGEALATAESQAVGSTESQLSGSLDRKESTPKIKKGKTKPDKQTGLKVEAFSKSARTKGVHWLERELNKIEREKQRLEREKEKNMEKEARLESMWQAYRQGQVQKKEVLIKTSTGEFRFEGISQTFTKRLFEWEERRNIRPESSTIALLGPSFTDGRSQPATAAKNGHAAPGVGGQDTPCSPDLGRLSRSKSESSVADLTGACSGGCSGGVQGAPSMPSTLSLTEKTEAADEQSSMGEMKASSEPTLAGDETLLPSSSSQAIFQRDSYDSPGLSPIIQDGGQFASDDVTQYETGSGEAFSGDMRQDWRTCELDNAMPYDGLRQDPYANELVGTPKRTDKEAPKVVGVVIKARRKGSVSRQSSARSLASLKAAYAPAEITRLIDSSDSDDEIMRRRRSKKEYGLPGGPMLRPPPRVLRPSDSLRSESSYQDLLEENMCLLEQLRTQEVVCRALQTQMGDIDSKMDSVTDQHIKTLEKLHEQVTIMKDSVAATDATDEPVDSESMEVDKSMKTSVETLSESNLSAQDASQPAPDFAKPSEEEPIEIVEKDIEVSTKFEDMSTEEIECDDLPEEKTSLEELSEQHEERSESSQSKRDLENQILISQLRQRISELEIRGECLQKDKEKLETSFQHHKGREASLAQSLLLRMRELHVAEADWHMSAPELPGDSLDEEKRNVTGNESSAVMEPKLLEEITSVNTETSNIDKDAFTKKPASASHNDNLADKQSLAKRAKAIKRQTRIHDEEETTAKQERKQNPVSVSDQARFLEMIDMEINQASVGDLSKTSNRSTPDVSNELRKGTPNIRHSVETPKLLGDETGKSSSQSALKVDHKKAGGSPTPGDGRKLSSTLERRHEESENIRSVRKKCKDSSSSERKSSGRREKSRSSTVERKRRSRHGEHDDSQDDTSGDRDPVDRAARKRRKTPTKKVMKLHNLTADLLFQAKRLEQALVSKHHITREDVATAAAATHAAVGAIRGHHTDHRALRGRSSLRLAGEAPPRHPHHVPKVPGQTRTWSSIETIAAPSDVPVTGRSPPTGDARAPPSEVGSQPDLLALNAEISRMAKELRIQMMDLWTFRESTSPESGLSEREDGRRVDRGHSIEDKSEARRKLFQEAQEVFNSIASLRRSQDTPSPSSPMSPVSPLPTSISFLGSIPFHTPPKSPKCDLSWREALLRSRDTSGKQGQGHCKPAISSPPSHSRTQRSSHFKGSLRPSLTSPSLTAIGGGSEGRSSHPQRSAWSLDLDDPIPKEDLLTHWVAGAELEARHISKGGSIEEEEDDSVFEGQPDDLKRIRNLEMESQEPNESQITNNSTEFPQDETISNEGDSCKFFLGPQEEEPLKYQSKKSKDEKQKELSLKTRQERLKIIETPDVTASAPNSPRNLPDLDQLLPKGPNTTFADLIRVHDQLHKIEQEKQAKNDNSLKRKSDGQQQDFLRQQRDHLKEAFETSQNKKSTTDAPFYENNYMPKYSSSTAFAPSQRTEFTEAKRYPSYFDYPCSEPFRVTSDQPVPSQLEEPQISNEYTGYPNRSIVGSLDRAPGQLADQEVTSPPPCYLQSNEDYPDPNNYYYYYADQHEAVPPAPAPADGLDSEQERPRAASTGTNPIRKNENVYQVKTIPVKDKPSSEKQANLIPVPPAVMDPPPLGRVTSPPDEMDRSSQFGTWKTSASSKSFDHVLSSSFEWELETFPMQNPEKKQTSVPSLLKPSTRADVFGDGRFSPVTQLPSSTSNEKTETEQRQERSQYETEVTSEHNQTSLGRLRTRRVSDTQVEYHESSGRKVHRKASGRESSNVIVPTKRTIFTPTSNALHATPTFLQPVGEDFTVPGCRGAGVDPSKAENVLPDPYFSRNLIADSKSTAVTAGEFNALRTSATEDSTSATIVSRPLNKTQHDELGHSEQTGARLRENQLSELSTSAEAMDLMGSPFLWRGTSVPGYSSGTSGVSSPVESKRKILEAANKASGETSPTVKGMIEQYNRRITERQSLLTSPFKYWLSDVSSPTNLRKTSIPPHLSIPSSSVLKSSSDTRVPDCSASPDILQGIQKSASGPTWNSSREGGGTSVYSITTVDTSLDTSIDDVHIPGVRAFKIKKAKEEFFSRGSPGRRETKKRYSNCSTDTTSRDSLNISIAATPSPQPTIVVSAEVDMNEKPPRTGLRRSSTPRKDALRRENTSGTIFKSASSGVVESRKQNPIRPSSTEPMLHSGRSSKGIFRLFRRSKEKDRKEMPIVQKLCRHSLEVDIERLDRAKEKRPSSTSAELPGCSGTRYQLEPPEARSSSTLPRPCEGPPDGPSTRSCPSSPVSQHRSKTISWLARGKELLKGRSPSPNVFKSVR